VFFALVFVKRFLPSFVLLVLCANFGWLAVAVR